MTVNEATWDRAIRVVAGLVFLYLGWGGVVAGGLGTFCQVLRLRAPPDRDRRLLPGVPAARLPHEEGLEPARECPHRSSPRGTSLGPPRRSGSGAGPPRCPPKL